MTPTPKKKRGNYITDTYTRVDKTVTIILEDEGWLKKGRVGDLKRRVCEEFDIANRTAEKLIAAAKLRIRELMKKDRDKMLKKARLDREWVISKAKESGDVKLALAGMQDRDKLNELYTETVEHKGAIQLTNVDLKKLTDEQLTILEGIIRRGDDPKPYLISIGVNC
ncbi:MAG: hypothetical protein PHX51_07080 [Clostridia bacterium]|nr:hypothetical protein [Clostridia bacterium]